MTVSPVPSLGHRRACSSWPSAHRRRGSARAGGSWSWSPTRIARRSGPRRPRRGSCPTRGWPECGRSGADRGVLEQQGYLDRYAEADKGWTDRDEAAGRAVLAHRHRQWPRYSCSSAPWTVAWPLPSSASRPNTGDALERRSPAVQLTPIGAISLATARGRALTVLRRGRRTTERRSGLRKILSHGKTASDATPHHGSREAPQRDERSRPTAQTQPRTRNPNAMSARAKRPAAATRTRRRRVRICDCTRAASGAERGSDSAVRCWAHEGTMRSRSSTEANSDGDLACADRARPAPGVERVGELVGQGGHPGATIPVLRPPCGCAPSSDAHGRAGRRAPRWRAPRGPSATIRPASSSCASRSSTPSSARA